MLPKRVPRVQLIVFLSTIALVVLMGVVVLFASSMIMANVSTQFQRREEQLADSLSSHLSLFFEVLGTEVEHLTSHPELLTRDDAFLSSTVSSLENVRSLTRLTAGGQFLFGWPADTTGWAVTDAAAREMALSDTIQLRTMVIADQMALVLFSPMADSSGLLGVEVNLEPWFARNRGLIDLDEAGQLWLLDAFGNLLLELDSESPAWSEQDGLSMTAVMASDEPRIVTYASDTGSRQAAVATVKVGGSTLYIVLSRSMVENRTEVRSQLYGLFGLVGGAVVLTLVLAWGVLRRLTHEARRREGEAQRRRVVRTLLDVSRAVNSSLDLQVVLQRILNGLSALLEHDTSSILLYREQDKRLVMAARTQGGRPAFAENISFELSELTAAAEVLSTAEPIFIPDCGADPRWSSEQHDYIRSYLGVPLRVGHETVGILNINCFRLNAFKPEDIETAQTFADQASVAMRNARLHEQQIKQYEEGLENARDIQTSLMPQEDLRLPKLEIAGRSLPAHVVSGDYFHFLPRLDGHLGVVVGDVTGKGMPAALLMAVMTTAIRREFDRQHDVGSLFNELNESLFEQLQLRHMTSALSMVVFDPTSSRVDVANAGMIQPYFRNSDGRWRLLPVTGYPLGAALKRNYQAQQVKLEPGSMIVLTSDGVVESLNPTGQFFGFDRLEALLDAVPPDLDAEGVCIMILEAVYQHLDGREAQDDITVVVMRSLGA